jgi:hypothetical protein
MRNYESFAPLIQLRRQPIGRMMFAINQTRRQADALRDAVIVGQCDEFLRSARQTRLLVMRYSAEQRNPESRADVMDIDNEADRLAGVMFRSADEYRKHFPSDHPKGKMAREFIMKCYPSGLRALVHQTHVEQLDDLETIIELGQTELASHISELNLTDWFERLVEITDRYRQALESPRAETITYIQVRDALNDCHERLLQIVAKALGTYNDRSADHAESRRRLLQPIMTQDAFVAEYNRRRRNVIDVDPDTGVEAPLPVDVFVSDAQVEA